MEQRRRIPERVPHFYQKSRSGKAIVSSVLSFFSICNLLNTSAQCVSMSILRDLMGNLDFYQIKLVLIGFPISGHFHSIYRNVYAKTLRAPGGFNESRSLCL